MFFSYPKKLMHESSVFHKRIAKETKRTEASITEQFHALNVMHGDRTNMDDLNEVTKLQNFSQCLSSTSTSVLTGLSAERGNARGKVR
jgi:hypothetical protein